LVKDEFIIAEGYPRAYYLAAPVSLHEHFVSILQLFARANY